jgi:ACS family hexuronate transporter-like MFS transporter
LPAGLLDRLGISRGLSLAVTWWSIAGTLTRVRSWVRSASPRSEDCSLLAKRERGPFAKAAATWVPPSARTLVIGICNSGSSLGAMIAPPLVAFVTLRWGWRASFIVTGLIGFVWVALFQLFRAFHPQMDLMDRAARDPASRGFRWKTLLGYRQTWAVFVCRFFADPLGYASSCSGSRSF